MYAYVCVCDFTFASELFSNTKISSSCLTVTEWLTTCVYRNLNSGLCLLEVHTFIPEVAEHYVFQFVTCYGANVGLRLILDVFTYVVLLMKVPFDYKCENRV